MKILSPIRGMINIIESERNWNLYDSGLGKYRGQVLCIDYGNTKSGTCYAASSRINILTFGYSHVFQGYIVLLNLYNIL